MSLSQCAADIRFCPLLCRLEKTTFYVFFCAPFHNQKYYYLFYEIFRIRFEMVQMEIFGIHLKYLVRLELVKGEVEL